MTRRGKAVLKEAGGMMGRAGRGKERSGEGEGGEGEEGGPLVGSERSLCSEEGGYQVRYFGKGSTQRKEKEEEKHFSDYIFNKNVHCQKKSYIERDNNAVQEKGMDI